MLKYPKETQKNFSVGILRWYRLNSRNLPWRENNDPYRVWLSEVILQQTRVDQGLPYFEKFVKKFKTISKLASAHEDVVLRLWQGLGYYSRARNLHRCSKIIADQYKGIFPSTSEALLQLPGIGGYTAAAIASISFGERVAVLDGNVFRVLSRFFGVDVPINSREGKKVFSALAQQLLNESPKSHFHPGEYNQGIMELGALICTPRSPRCEDCPVSSGCFAFQKDLVEQLPVKLAKAGKRERYFYYLMVRKENSVWMKKRTQSDIWKGLYDFPCIESDTSLKMPAIKQKFKEWIGNADLEWHDSVKHLLTHQKLFISFFISNSGKIATLNKFFTGKYYTRKEAARLPKPKVIDDLLKTGFM